MLHGVSVFTPVVQVDAQKVVFSPSDHSTGDIPGCWLRLLSVAFLFFFFLFFSIRENIETLVHHRAKLQGLLAVSSECAAHSEI